MSPEDKPSDQKKKGFSGLSGMVSDVEGSTPSEDVSTSAEAAQAQEAPSQRRSEPPSQRPEASPPRSAPQPYQQSSAPRSSSSGAKWLIGIVAVIGFIWFLAESGEESSTQRSRTTASSPAPQVNAPEPSGFDEVKPSPGTNNVLTTSQIRYCLAEDIRLGAAQDVVNTYVDSEVDRFNAMVTDYNIRCVEFRYREGALQRARSDIERYRLPLQAEGRSRFGSGSGGAGVGSGSGGRADVDWEAPFAELIDEQRNAPEPAPTVRSNQTSDAPRIAETEVRDRSDSKVTKPDLSTVESWEQAAIEKACNSAQLYSGPADYYSCLKRELRELQAHSGKPDLSGATPSERQAIERACQAAQRYSGPGDYYSCLRRELAKAGYR